MHEGSYCTYIMASRSRTLYIGVTGNLHQRVFEHKWKERDGFTALQLRSPRVLREFSVHPKSDCAGEGTEGLETRKEDCADRINEPGVDGFESRLVRLRTCRLP